MRALLLGLCLLHFQAVQVAAQTNGWGIARRHRYKVKDDLQTGALSGGSEEVEQRRIARRQQRAERTRALDEAGQHTPRTLIEEPNLSAAATAAGTKGSTNSEAENSDTVVGEEEVDPSQFDDSAARLLASKAPDVWLYSLLSADYEGAALLPHFLRHYYDLGVAKERLLLVVNHNAQAPGVPLDALSTMTDALDAADVDYALWLGQYNPDTHLGFLMRALQEVPVQDWVIMADSDEFQTYSDPATGDAMSAGAFLAAVAAANASWVKSTYMDRVAADGKLRSVTPAPALFEQFPLECGMSRRSGKGDHKVAAFRAFLRPGVSKHGVLPPYAAMKYYGPAMAGTLSARYGYCGADNLYPLTPYAMYSQYYRQSRRQKNPYLWQAQAAADHVVKVHHFRWRTGLERSLADRLRHYRAEDEPCAGGKPRYKHFQEQERSERLLAAGGGAQLNVTDKSLFCKLYGKPMWQTAAQDAFEQPAAAAQLAAATQAIPAEQAAAAQQAATTQAIPAEQAAAAQLAATTQAIPAEQAAAAQQVAATHAIPAEQTAAAQQAAAKQAIPAEQAAAAQLAAAAQAIPAEQAAAAQQAATKQAIPAEQAAAAQEMFELQAIAVEQAAAARKAAAATAADHVTATHEVAASQQAAAMRAAAVEQAAATQAATADQTVAAQAAAAEQAAATEQASAAGQVVAAAQAAATQQAAAGQAMAQQRADGQAAESGTAQVESGAAQVERHMQAAADQAEAQPTTNSGGAAVFQTASVQTDGTIALAWDAGAGASAAGDAAGDVAGTTAEHRAGDAAAADGIAVVARRRLLGSGRRLARDEWALRPAAAARALLQVMEDVDGESAKPQRRRPRRKHRRRARRAEMSRNGAGGGEGGEQEEGSGGAGAASEERSSRRRRQRLRGSRRAGVLGSGPEGGMGADEGAAAVRRRRAGLPGDGSGGAGGTDEGAVATRRRQRRRRKRMYNARRRAVGQGGAANDNPQTSE